MRLPSRQSVGYVAVLGTCLVLGIVAGWTPLGAQIDNYFYDFMFRFRPAWTSAEHSAILAIDEQTLMEMGGMRQIRGILATGLEALQGTKPTAVVIDLILADRSDPEQDARLAAAMAGTPNLVLASDLIPSGWEDPLPEFRSAAVSVGHAHADPDPADGITRQVPLEKVAGRDRRWALALEAFRIWHGSGEITESPRELDVGGVRIPSPREASRPVKLRYFRDRVVAVPVEQVVENPGQVALFRNKVVFVGVTAQSAADDLHMTPYSGGQQLPGVEIHATAFETLAGGRFLVSASETSVLLFCLAVTLCTGLVFAWRSGWEAYFVGGVLLAVAHGLPAYLFRYESLVFSYAPAVSTAWLSVVGAATYQHFVVRRKLAASETARGRYQKAIHFVTHEMRSPLTAIQGSSELIGRYDLPEDKSKQLAQMINAESKRLARMIQTFLDVERLTEGEMALKREQFPLATMLEASVERARPLAERKQIGLRVGEIAETELVGDRELMEYAVYNLLNNAVKYSPAKTEITVFSRRDGHRVRLSVRDQGIGMDETEVRSVFQKFYRTKRAEASGEAGSGIGLSIVEEIVSHHGGKMEVTSRPGAGSCFTMVLPVSVAAGSAEAH